MSISPVLRADTVVAHTGSRNGPLLTPTSKIILYWSQLGEKALHPSMGGSFDSSFTSVYTFTWVSLSLLNSNDDGSCPSVLIKQEKYQAAMFVRGEGVNKGFLDLKKVLQVVKKLAKDSEDGQGVDFLCPESVDGGGSLSSQQTLQFLGSLVNMGKDIIQSMMVEAPLFVKHLFKQDFGCSMKICLEVIEQISIIYGMMHKSASVGASSLEKLPRLSSFAPGTLSLKDIMKVGHKEDTCMTKEGLKSLLREHKNIVQDFVQQWNIDVILGKGETKPVLKQGFARSYCGNQVVNLMPLYSFVPGWQEDVISFTIDAILNFHRFIE
ncbi:hypothetical protein CLAVI_000303 [Candidatus Clavichlamydia salmonicola]|uniref:hypothetical protein n=1 Tax=Candidatus Clavichlamydia salmonicola TaxID=469812 RepID=UPI0018912AF4|nr:hypothetical protein [Candidatus Clavichlamydia salmonicola]MBF5050688.1 hypothetical protein [Candidatus Clavichlamydia salmonicola]